VPHRALNLYDTPLVRHCRAKHSDVLSVFIQAGRKSSFYWARIHALVLMPFTSIMTTQQWQEGAEQRHNWTQPPSAPPTLPLWNLSMRRLIFDTLPCRRMSSTPHIAARSRAAAPPSAPPCIRVDET